MRKTKGEMERTANKTFRALKSAMVDACRSFSRGADRVADIIVDKGGEEAGTPAKAKKIKGAVVSTAREIGGAFKKNLKDIDAEDILHDTSYAIGRFSKLAKDGCAEFLDVVID